MQKSINPTYRHPSQSFNIRLNLSCALALAGLFFAMTAPRIANGKPEGGVLQHLADSYVGIYREAHTFKLFSGEYLDETGRRLNAGTYLELFNLLDSDELSLQQPAACFRKGLAKGCYLPFIELSLGQVLALASSLFMVGLLVAFWDYRRMTTIIAGLTVGLGGSLFLVGSANGLQFTQSLVQQLASAHVGVYGITLQSTDDRHYISQDGTNLWTLHYKSSRVLRHPPACYVSSIGIYVCSQTVMELSLGKALLAVLGLALVTTFLAWKIQLRRN